MKKIYLILIVALVSTNVVYGQLWGDNNSRTDYRDDAGLMGNAGAVSGFFQTVNPTNYPAGASSWWHLLDVRHSNPNNNFAMQFAGSFWDQNLYFRKTNNNAAQPWSRVLTQDANGILTTGTLTVNGNFNVINGGNQFSYNGAADVHLQYVGRGSGGRAMVHDDNNRLTLNYGGDFTGGTLIGTNVYFALDNTGTSYIYSGNVAIGTADTKGYKFAVAGSAIAESVTVKLQANWPDYVFKPTYTLTPLSDLKTYIDQNHHLPEIPSEKEVAEKGLNLGEMNKLLTKKVEELTLYLIEKDKEMKELKSTQEDQMKKLEQRLEILEKNQQK